jgi:hypothetical protein
MFLALTRLPQIGAPITTGFLSCRMTIAVNRAAIRHHPFEYLQNIAANCRQAKVMGDRRKTCASEHKAVVEAAGRPPLQAPDQMATIFTPPLIIRAHRRAKSSRRRACAFALFS